MRLTPVLAVSMLLLTGLCRADAATDACDAAQKLVDNRSSLADYDRAMELYQKAIDLGDKRGQAETGIGWIYSWRKHDQAEALRWWTKGCELGDAGGCANAFTALTDDNKHPAAGMALLERGREAGCLWATKELRDIYRGGSGVPQDGAKADALERELGRAIHADHLHWIFGVLGALILASLLWRTRAFRVWDARAVKEPLVLLFSAAYAYGAAGMDSQGRDGTDYLVLWMVCVLPLALIYIPAVWRRVQHVAFTLFYFFIYIILAYAAYQWLGRNGDPASTGGMGVVDGLLYLTVLSRLLVVKGPGLWRRFRIYFVLGVAGLVMLYLAALALLGKYMGIVLLGLLVLAALAALIRQLVVKGPGLWRRVRPEAKPAIAGAAPAIVKPEPRLKPEAKPRPKPQPEAQPLAKPKARAPQLTVAAEADNPAGALVGGKYRLVQELGRGGMGIVYEALDVKLDRVVALKKMREELKLSPREMARFFKEARLVAKLQHPAIVAVHDILDDAADPWVVFEYVKGRTLDQLLEKQERLSLAQALALFVPVAEALEHAHQQGVVHRDLKPSNMMLTDDGHAKVMDFGIARQVKDTVSRVSGKDSSGTLAYMAPEQELGANSPQCDVFAFGVCLYEALTGEPPFAGPNFLAQKREMRYQPASQRVAGLPPALDALLAACLQADPTDRPQGMGPVAAALRGLAGA